MSSRTFPVQNALFRMWLDDPIVGGIYIAGDRTRQSMTSGVQILVSEEAHTTAHGDRSPTTGPRVTAAWALWSWPIKCLGSSHTWSRRRGRIARWLQRAMILNLPAVEISGKVCRRP